MSNTRRFFIQTCDVKPNDVNEEMHLVQKYLRRFGYLQQKCEDRRLDEPTEKALKLYQRNMSLKETGYLDKETVDVLNLPRCGLRDIPPSGEETSSSFVVRGCSYQAKFRTLTYAFINGTNDINGNSEQQAVRNAFATWQREIPIDFQEVGLANNPNFRIGWFSGSHGDNNPFDGIGNVLAHAFYPPPCGGLNAGALHFDEDETWGLSHSINTFDTETVALHEIGHLLGLDHSTIQSAVMFANYGGQLHSLSNDDIQGVRSLYGRRGPQLRVLSHLRNIGDRVFRDNEFTGTKGQPNILEGFQINITQPIPNVSLRYKAHLQGVGDVAFVGEGQFVGTRGQSRRLEGFSIELTGSAASNYNVLYMAQLEGQGDTPILKNGQFCGTRGQSRSIEGILVRIEPK